MKDKIFDIVVILVIVFVILCCIWGALAIYKMIVFNKIFNNMTEKVALENYYMKVISKEDTESNMEVFYKDGVGKFVASNGSYTWTDGTEAYFVVEADKTYYKLDMNAPGLVSNEMVGSMLPGYSESTFGRLLLAGKLTTSVKTKNVEGIKYYVIKTKDTDEEKTIWFNKENLIPSQVTASKGSFNASYNYEIKFEDVKSADVEKPKLEEYTLIETELESTTSSEEITMEESTETKAE